MKGVNTYTLEAHAITYLYHDAPGFTGFVKIQKKPVPTAFFNGVPSNHIASCAKKRDVGIGLLV